jgi:hypothetical protein
MKKPWLILLLLIAAAGFGLTCRAFGQSSTDETVQQDLNTAKSGRTSAVNQAVATMSAGFDAQIRALSATGDADSARILSTQKAAFVAGGTLPQSPLMGQAVTQYQ